MAVHTAKKSLCLANSAHQRGSLLLEAALAVGVVVSVFGLATSISAEQQRRADAVTLAGEKRIIVDAARNYVFDRRNDLIDALFLEAQSSGSAGMLVVEIADLVSEGYLSTSFTPGAALSRLTGQDYVLLLRAVFQDDATIPAATLTEADMDPFALGTIDPRFIDGDPLNGEIGIEAVLFSTGGTPLPPGQGGRVTEATQRINAGFVFSGQRSRGPGGTMDFNISGFAGLPAFAAAGEGRFATPIALGSIGVLGETGGTGGSGTRETFLRCVGIEPTSPVYNECMTAPRNQVFGHLQLQPSDQDEDGTPDTFPAILGATRLLCIDAIGDESDAVDPDVFLIDCQTTRVNGVLDLTGPSVLFAGENLVERREINGADETVVTAERLAIRLPSGDERDLVENIFESVTIPARGLIDAPECPATALDGTPLSPRATASVAVALDPWGRAISGTFAMVERGNEAGGAWSADPNGSQFMARVLYTLNSDFCDADFGNPIDVRTTFADQSNSNSSPRFFLNTVRPDNGRCGDATAPNSNGHADIYEFFPVGSANYGAATINLSCGIPPT